jgi:hypothetical protein
MYVQSRSKTIQVRITPEEKTMVEELRRKEIRLSDLVRRAIQEEYQRQIVNGVGKLRIG